MGAPEKNLSAHHAHKRAVSEHILCVLGIDPANDGNSAGHEFSEIVSHRAHHPELRRCKPGVLLGHCHAPGADITGHVYFPLGHGIGCSVARISMDNDMGARIEPTQIIGGRIHDIDHGVWKSHGADALAGMTLDTDVDFVVSAFPKPSADSVLTKRVNHYFPVAAFDRLLDFFLKDTGIEPCAFLFSGYDIVMFGVHHDLSPNIITCILKYGYALASV